MPKINELLDELKQARDELQLKIHLGSRDAQDQWTELETRWSRFRSSAELDRSATEVAEALRLLGSELKDGYQRLRKAL